MAKTEHYYTKFYSDNFYHIYNRTVDLKPMFKSRENYLFFLRQYQKYLGQIVDTYAYNLLGNHFHLAIKIPSEERVDQFVDEINVNPNWDIHKIVSHQFQKFFQSYSMAFNKQYQRVGTLFQTPFKRTLIDNLVYLQNTITYIHQNAQHHNLVKDFRDWEWSSFNSLLSEKETKLKRKELLEHFTNIEHFQNAHNVMIQNSVFLDIEL